MIKFKRFPAAKLQQIFETCKKMREKIKRKAKGHKKATYRDRFAAKSKDALLVQEPY